MRSFTIAPALAALAAALIPVGSATAAPRAVVLQPGDEIRIATYDWRCVSVRSSGEIDITCWPLDSTNGPLVYLSSRHAVEVSASKAPTLWGYTRSPRDYTYQFVFGAHVALPFHVGESRDLVLRPGDSLRFAGIPGWSCQSTIRTPNFGCARVTAGGVTLAPVLTLAGGRALHVESGRPPVLQSLVANSRLYTWPQP